jgi:predicted P-loop ATPase
VNPPNTAGNPRLVAALGYAKRGWAVLPAQPRGKAPATKHGFKDATTEKATIVRAWTSNAAANVAIATGAMSGIVVLDVDPRNGGDGSLVELERLHGSLPETLTVATGGGGRHFYFAAPKGAVRSGVVADGLDFKADGGYVVAPPSTHPDGGQYRWVNAPANMKLAPLPDWLRPPSKSKAHEATHGASVPDAGVTPLGQAFAKAGLLGRLRDGGKRNVVCPWQEKHSTGALQDSSTVIFPASTPSGLGGFHCSHTHCAARTATEALRELERRAAAGSSERAWMAELRRTSKGELRASFGNLVQILTHDPASAGKLRLDEMRGAVTLAEVEMTDAAVSAIRVDFEQRYESQPGDAETARAVQLVASKNSFHPVRDFLLQLKWDGVPRLDSVAPSILRVRADNDEEAALAALLVRRWFICLVARPLLPGCKVDTALILEGAQGIGKSTFFRVLAGEWFSDTEMALDKDAMMQLRAAWIYEWSELENVMGRQSVSRVKAFLTSTEDKYRPPFGRTPVTVKRSGVIVGTTNNQDFLHDPSGSRRFWVVPVGAIDTKALSAQRDQLLAEAVVAHLAGEPRWLNEDEERRREALATRFGETDPWEELVLAFAAKQKHVRTTEVLLQALGAQIDKVTKRDEMRVTAVLRRAGYVARQSRVEGKLARYWVDPRRGDGRDGGDGA